MTRPTTALALADAPVAIGAVILLAGVSAGVGWALLISGLALGSEVVWAPGTGRRTAPDGGLGCGAAGRRNQVRMEHV
jgi:hypothetical protein